MAFAVRMFEPQAFNLKGDGKTPNNPALPFLYYSAVVSLAGAPDPAAIFERLFASHGWRGSWRNGIYSFTHFHTTTHEALGIADGEARVQFGGDSGPVVSVKAGDVAVLPAGTGHRRISSSRDLLVVGAYPPGGKYDLRKPGEIACVEALRAITQVELPDADPVYGREGPLTRLWRKA